MNLIFMENVNAVSCTRSTVFNVLELIKKRLLCSLYWQIIINIIRFGCILSLRINPNLGDECENLFQFYCGCCFLCFVCLFFPV